LPTPPNAPAYTGQPI